MSAKAGGAGSLPKQGVIAPAYFYPDLGAPESQWQHLVDAAGLLKDRLTAIANVFNGPGAAVDPNYTAAINAVRGAGGRMLGYVHTSYGGRATPDVRADIDAWFSRYSVDGIFLDEMAATPGQIRYSATLHDFVQAMRPGAAVVFNFGTSPHAGYFNIGDAVLCIFENAASAFKEWRPPSSLTAGQLARSAAIVHSLPGPGLSSEMKRSKGYRLGWHYFTSLTLPGTFNALPSYFAQEVSAAV